MNKIIRFFKKKEIKKYLQEWDSISNDISKPQIEYTINSSGKKAFNFRNGLVRELGSKNKSLNLVDSLFIDGSDFIFIEFINDFTDKKKELRLKALESPLELAKLLKKNNVIESIYDFKSLNFYFVVIHKKINLSSKEPAFFNKILPYKQLLSEVKNDLKQYEGVFYEKTLILTNENFEEIFANKLNKTKTKPLSLFKKILILLTVGLTICLVAFSLTFFLKNYTITFQF